ncbi:hypothetical protein D1007_48451 [Hordeum vulgare]|nr:hypothetical protein D1007_48451 [Hordeum vulgare]
MDQQSLVVLEKAVAAAVAREGDAVCGWGTEEQARAIIRAAKMALEEAAAMGESPSLLRSLERFLAQRRSDQTTMPPAPAVDVQPDGGDSTVSAALQDLAIN